MALTFLTAEEYDELNGRLQVVEGTLTKLTKQFEELVEELKTKLKEVKKE